MRVLWIHNFNPEKTNSGVFMHQSHDFILKNFSSKCQIELLYLGNLKNPINVLKKIIYIKKISKSYDIIHSQFGSLCGFVGMFAECRRILTLRGSDWYYFKGDNLLMSLHGFLQSLITRISLLRYSEIISVSNRMSLDIKKWVVKGDVTVLPSPVDFDKFYPIEKSTARLHLGLDLKKKYFLYPVFNKSNPIKRPGLIEKIASLLPSNIEIITATGHPHDEMIWLYNACDALVLPSIYEGWPNVIKEAMLCNVPFVATDVSDLREIANKAVNCFILEPVVSVWVDFLENYQVLDVDLRSLLTWMSQDNINSVLVNKYLETSSVHI